MPTVSITQLPRSQSAGEFENMCEDVLSIIYGIDFSFYGRTGQKQCGIDLVGQLSDKRICVAQCKNYYLSSYTKLQSQIQRDLHSMNELPFEVSEFVIMTSLSRDVDTINFIFQLVSSCKIKVLFWEDIQSVLCNNVLLLQKYYPQFYVEENIPIEVRNKIVTSAIKAKEIVEEIYGHYCNYRVAVHEKDDIILYNMCVELVMTVFELKRECDVWYMQLSKKKVEATIQKLLKSMPGFSDENQDGTGASMIYTITNYLDSFTDKDVADKFIKRCEKIIERI